MCGIFGYFGSRLAYPLLLNGLQRLEYRGYDSAGLSVIADGIKTVKAVGKVKNLEDRLKTEPLPGKVGIAHSRWATHGIPTRQESPTSGL